MGHSQFGTKVVIYFNILLGHEAGGIISSVQTLPWQHLKNGNR